MPSAARWSVLDVLWAATASLPALGTLIAWLLAGEWELGVATLLLAGVPVAVVAGRRSRRRAQREAGRAASRLHLRELSWVVLALVLLVGGILLVSTLS